MSSSHKYIISLDAITAEVRQEFEDLPKAELHLNPSAKNWSIAQNLAHLIVINSSYFPIFQKLKDGTYRGAFIGKIPFFPRLFGDMIYKSVSDGGKKKVKTFTLWEPEKLESGEDIIGRFISHQDEMKNWIYQMEPFVLQKRVIHSPANKLIVYSLEQALQIIIAHEWRHLDQAKNVLQNIKKENLKVTQ